MNTKIQDSKGNKSVKDTKNIDIDIDSLNKYLLEIKKNRRNSEKIEKQLSKRKLLLNKEEMKVEKQIKIEEKNKINIEQIKVNLLKNKQILEKKKETDKINLERQKSKNSIIKQEIDISLKSWKNNVKSKNKEEADRVKEERKLIENIKKSEKKDIKNNNRIKHDLIIWDHLKCEEKKKFVEKNRKMQIKKQLEEKIQKEIDLKQILHDKINKQNIENDEIIKRIKGYNPHFQLINMDKKRQKSCNTPKVRKISFKKKYII